MEILSADFFSALLAIIMIDLVLAGDNAIVIALAARNLPPASRNQAIVWGTVGAIAVRTVMTLVVVWLLKIPGLLLVGAILLIWIAYRLLVEHDQSGHEVRAAVSFWGAMRTIIVADAVMGLDNVLAVAGAAHGSFLLVVLGLLISVPIMVLGSQIVLRFVDRYPFIIYLGGAVLAWTAAGMIVHEPLLREFMATHAWFASLIHLTILSAVMGCGYWRNALVAQAHVAAHVLPEGRLPAASEAPVRILVPVDASGHAQAGVRLVLQRIARGLQAEVHLLHVAAPISQHVARFVRGAEREAHYREAADRVFEPIRPLLERAGVGYEAHAVVGERAAEIAHLAERLAVDEIVIGTAPGSSWVRVLEDTFTHRMLGKVSVPVFVVADERAGEVGVFAYMWKFARHWLHSD